jgi:hypothetical protein
MEIYFLSNQGNEEIRFEPSFRATGLKPQIWDAVTGKIYRLADYRMENGRTMLPVRLEAGQSCFIVFSNAENEYTRKGYSMNFPVAQKIFDIEGPWRVDFVNKDIGPSEEIFFDSLKDWKNNQLDAVRYYSGTAVYRTSFTLDSIPERGELFIDLGAVHVMASVKVNGSDIGTAWMAPYVLNTKDLLQPGENKLEIEVVNLWRNRLIGDKSLAQDQRYTFTIVDDIRPGERLQTSGLIGPVTIQLLQ